MAGVVSGSDTEGAGMEKSYKQSGFHSCRGCRSRSIEPNCHSYCPTYLAEKMALDEENARYREQQSVDLGIRDQRAASRRRNRKGCERRTRGRRR